MKWTSNVSFLSSSRELAANVPSSSGKLIYLCFTLPFSSGKLAANLPSSPGKLIYLCFTLPLNPGKSICLCFTLPFSPRELRANVPLSTGEFIYIRLTILFSSSPRKLIYICLTIFFYFKKLAANVPSSFKKLIYICLTIFFCSRELTVLTVTSRCDRRTFLSIVQTCQIMGIQRTLSASLNLWCSTATVLHSEHCCWWSAFCNIILDLKFSSCTSKIKSALSL